MKWEEVPWWKVDEGGLWEGADLGWDFWQEAVGL